MQSSSDVDRVAAFEALRPGLLRIAYRMLGSVADAEDIVQDAFLRWRDVDESEVRRADAYVRQVVSRLCLDFLKSARHRCEVYIGPWLPEPVVTDEIDTDQITLPLMLLLERLTPTERAAFLLHDVFGLTFEEIAATLDRDPAACRKLASRARVQVRAGRPRFEVPADRGREIARAFFDASRRGDLQRLQSLLSAEVTLYADGGGRVSAAAKPILGAEAVFRLHAGLARIFAASMSQLLRYCLINGLPGFVTVEGDGTLQTTALEIIDDQIAAIYITRNPDKLSHLRGLTRATLDRALPQSERRQQ